MIIDFHSHILPGVDHGSKSSEESKQQLDIVNEAGVDIIVATSHFYPHVHKVEEFLHAVDIASKKVSEFKEHYKSTRICIGAEVLLCEMMDKMQDLEKLCIRGTKTLLLEMPSAGSWSRSLVGTVENILNNDYTVVLAHIDRYIKKYEDDIDSLLSMGAMAQINADSLVSFFSRKKLMPYFENGLVCAIGSDLHGADKKSYKAFADSRKSIGDNAFESVMKKSEKILSTAEMIN